MNVIIKSGKKNWCGKEFSEEYPAKLYTSFEDAVDAIKSYHLQEYNLEKMKYIRKEVTHKIEFHFLSESKRDKLLSQKLIRL